MIARYRVHTGQKDHKSVIGDLFGKKAVSAVSDLPSHLSMLEARIKYITGMNADALIDFHTLAPAYFPFLHPQNAKLTIKSMKSSFGGDIHVRAGISASKVKLDKYFRVCPECQKDQLETLGEAYWRRLHQLPGVTSCTDHSVSLCSTSVNYRSIEKHNFEAASLYTKLDILDLSNSYSEKEEIIQTHYRNLLSAEGRYFVGFHQWFQFYLEAAEINGLKSGKRIDHEGVHSVLRKYWQGTSLFHYLENQNSSWLIDIFRKHRKVWFRPTEAARYHAEQSLKSIIEAQGGKITSSFTHTGIAYHALRGELPIEHIKSVIDKGADHLQLMRCDDVMFFRPLGQCGFTLPEDTEEYIAEEISPSAET